MIYKADLHIHSKKSFDGRMSVSEIIEKAKSKGLNAIAITDHDGYFDGEAEGIEIIRGCEFSTEYGHLLGLFMTDPIVEKDFHKIVSGVHEQGGIVVLAHPYQRRNMEEKVESIAHLIDGVEVFNSRAAKKNKEANRQAKAFADRHGLLYFAGSDSHLPGEIGNVILTCEGDDIRSALTGGFISIEGKHSDPVNTARSQFTRFKNAGWTPKTFIKWCLFALKCLFSKKEKENVVISKDR
ncbi:MAG: PHP domain-containing protein [Clostridia bacterium]|nr:PHP domain-containing protein [Clostridia bacterium]